jgi:hypothetical protein
LITVNLSAGSAWEFEPHIEHLRISGGASRRSGKIIPSMYGTSNSILNRSSVTATPHSYVPSLSLSGSGVIIPIV